jgi:hypothetical protein
MLIGYCRYLQIGMCPLNKKVVPLFLYKKAVPLLFSFSLQAENRGPDKGMPHSTQGVVPMVIGQQKNDNCPDNSYYFMFHDLKFNCYFFRAPLKIIFLCRYLVYPYQFNIF